MHSKRRPNGGYVDEERRVLTYQSCQHLLGGRSAFKEIGNLKGSTVDNVVQLDTKMRIAPGDKDNEDGEFSLFGANSYPSASNTSPNWPYPRQP